MLWHCWPGGLAGPARLPAWANVPKLEDLTECLVFLEMAGVESRALEPTSRRHTGGNRILIFSPIGPISIRQVVSHAGEHLLKRSFEVYAERDVAFDLSIAYDFPQAESFYSWWRKDTSSTNVIESAFSIVERGGRF